MDQPSAAPAPVDQRLVPAPTAGAHKVSERELEDIGFACIPFRSRLSFRPLIERLLEQRGTDPVMRGFQQQLRALTTEFPALLEDFPGNRVPDELRPAVELVLSSLFPVPLQERQLGKVSALFSFEPVYETPRLRRLREEHGAEYVLNKPKSEIANTAILQACSVILNKLYGQHLDVNPGFLITLHPDNQPTESHYRLEFNFDFVEIDTKGEVPPMTQTDINELLGNIYDIERWLHYLPPERYEIRGIVVVRLVDVTVTETRSRLLYNLLERDAILFREGVQRQEKLLRTYFGNPNLRLGITAIDYPEKNVVHHAYKIRHDFLAHRQPDLLAPANRGSVYEKAVKYGETVVVECLGKIKHPTPVERQLMEEGIHSLLVAPLRNKDGRTLGILEIGCYEPYAFNSLLELRFRDIVPLFRMALERSREEVDNRIEAVVRSEFTAIHPAVEWKFIETAYHLIERRETEGPGAQLDPIRFEGVYPLYGQADIVGSSTLRNTAIQADFLANLEAACDVLRLAATEIDFPLLDQYRSRIEAQLDYLQRAQLTAGDETRIMEFIKEELHPVFRLLKREENAVHAAVLHYERLLDPDFGIIYQQRRHYEESVALLNERIGKFLDKEQLRTQAMLPHFFEQYRTDGVQYDMYVGQALLRNREYQPIHLRNLRLWQLISMCQIARQVEALKAETSMPLDTAQLVFVYHNPLTIVFRTDEKRFDVEGAYNVRYEIIKKRIDKSLVAGTGERLTQAGKIAIVYNNEKDYAEYRDYLRYLIDEGYLEDRIEELAIDKLQGVEGLHALRVTVRL